MRLLLLAVGIAVALFCCGLWRLSDGFSVKKMGGCLPFDPRFKIENLPTCQIETILSQPFYYSGKGSQCFVFESYDRQYVLKFFRLSRYRLPSFLESLHLPSFLNAIQNQRQSEKRLKREALFASCKLAFDELREECGLIYMQLNPANKLNQKVSIYDNLRRKSVIEIDRYPFIIQRKGEQMYSYIGRLINEGKQEEVQKALMTLSTLLDRRKERGILDHDAEIHKNTGFYQGKAFFIDIGQFQRGEAREDREQVVQKLLLWMDSKEPSLADEARFILYLGAD